MDRPGQQRGPRSAPGAILEADRALLERAAQRLLEAETLESDVLDELLAEARHPSKARQPVLA
jgi:ATP-dependent Zn protease